MESPLKHCLWRFVGSVHLSRSRMRVLLMPNVRGHRADEMKDATRSAASEASGWAALLGAKAATECGEGKANATHDLGKEHAKHNTDSGRTCCPPAQHRDRSGQWPEDNAAKNSEPERAKGAYRCTQNAIFSRGWIRAPGAEALRPTR